jgi:peptide/nickel transport system substrate-binding protein
MAMVETMKRETFTLYLFKLFLIFGLFVWTGMLYWSSLLVEEGNRTLVKEMKTLKQDFVELKKQNEKVRNSIKNLPSQTQENQQVEEHQSTATIQRPFMDPNLPNMLKEDPFYETTLPKMLGDNFTPHGTIHESTIGKPDDLHPFSNWGVVNGWIGMCNVSVSGLAFGKYETFAPNMAIKMERRGNEFWIFLRDDVYWQPLSPDLFTENIKLAPQFLRKNKVTAHDFKFHFDATMNLNNQEAGALAMRTYLMDVEKVEVKDDLTFVVRWKAEKVPGNEESHKIKYIAAQITGGFSPLASFVYKYFADGTKIVEDDSDSDTYLKDSVWAQNFTKHWAKNIIISCGPWIFDGMNDTSIKFRRNPDFYNPLDVLVQKHEVTFRNSNETVWQDFTGNHVESTILTPDQLEDFDNFLKSDRYQEQAKANAAIKRLDYIFRAYAYIGWNEATPFFKNKVVRQAMTSAIDRQRIIKQTLHGMGIEITGPFYVYSKSYNQSIRPMPFDMHHAKALLEEDGWYDSDGDGIIDKEIDGKRVPFKFSITYFVKNTTAKTICEYVATSLKQLGIECKLNGVDIADLSASLDGKTFDATLMLWALGTPPEDPRQLWSSEGAKQTGSSNFIGFSNKEIDHIIDQLDYEDDPEKRLALYHKFHAIIADEQPYTFLFTPKRVMLYREYLENVFIPADRQDLVPGADIGEPIGSIYWIKEHE